MVLVRRILQYNPASRPSTEEILSDPWLTGKRLIPRQQNKPKWVNPYHARKEDGDVQGPEVVGTNPVYYKATLPERGPEATITVNHDKNETVVLKSRTGNKKNIWISGPPTNHRPNTWPRSERDKVAGSAKPKRGSSGPRGSSAKCGNTKTSLVIRTPNPNPPCPRKKCTSGKSDAKTRVSTKAINMSKWFMEKYMNGKEALKKTEGSTDCECCKAEAAMTRDLVDADDIEEELCFDGVDPFQQYPDFEDVRFPSPVKNDAEARFAPSPYIDGSVYSSVDTKIDPKKSTSPSRAENGTCKSAGASKENKGAKSAAGRKSAAKSAGARTVRKRGPSSHSNTPEPSKPCLVNYMVSRSTSPAERVKYFRDRLMKLYGNEKGRQDGTNGLPPLTVLALKPQSQPASPEPPTSKSATSGRKPGPGTWRAKRNSAGPTTRPVQRVVVHSALP